MSVADLILPNPKPWCDINVNSISTPAMQLTTNAINNGFLSTTATGELHWQVGTGPLGPSGPGGVTGAGGPTGSTGPLGSPGPIGATGASGATGVTGAIGPDVEQGIVGITGINQSVNVAGKSVVLAEGSGICALYSFANGIDGQVVYIASDNGTALAIQNNGAGSQPFLTQTGHDIVIPALSSSNMIGVACAVYSSSLGKWLVSQEA